MSDTSLSENNEPKRKLNKESFKKSLKIFEYIKPYKWYLIASLFLVFISTISFYGLLYLIGLIVDVALGKSNFEITLNQVGMAMIAVLVVQGLTSYFRVTFTAKVSENGIADLRKNLYKKIITLPITFFEENKSGDLISRISADVSKLYSVFSITLIEFFRQIINLVVGIGFLVVVAPRLSAVMLVTIPFVILTALFFAKKIRKLSKERQSKLAESNSHLGESIQSIQIVKAFANEVFENKKYNETLTDVVSIAMRYAKSRAWFSLFIMTIFFGAICFIIYMGARMLQTGTMTAGELLSFVSFTGLIGGSIAGLGNFTTELLGVIGATERVRGILDIEPELDLSVEKDANQRLNGTIEFQEVEFTYPSRKDIQILKGINFKVEKGQKIALVGPSGVGKSTIIQLILRFYEINKGQIFVDGQSIYDYELRGFRNNIALVPQEVILFGGSIKENILYGKEEATEEEVIIAAQKSNSWEFIQSFPEGLETLIGERGVKLSGGQRQRIAIARAILKDPAILLLDEATSALDTESEKIVQDALNNLMENRTSIIIAHRLSTIVDVDKIYVLDKGMIKEEGTHQELMLNESSSYYKQASLGRLFELKQ